MAGTKIVLIATLNSRSKNRLTPMSYLFDRVLLTALTTSLLGLPLALSRCCAVLALPPVPIAQTQAAPDAVVEQLLGEWQFAEEGETVTLIFAPDSTLFFILPDGQGSAIAVQMGYAVNSSTQPMQLDMIVSASEKALTIFELTPEGKLRIDLNVTPGDPRPDQFDDRAASLDRISDRTVPPDSLEVVELDRTQPSVPVQFIGILLQGQRAYYLENGSFTTEVGELGFATTLESEEYFYRLISPDNDAESLAIAATPKTDDLPSYAGAIFALSDNGETKTLAGICKTDKPSLSPPIPTPPQPNASTLQCPQGSSLVE